MVLERSRILYCCWYPQTQLEYAVKALQVWYFSQTISTTNNSDYLFIYLIIKPDMQKQINIYFLLLLQCPGPKWVLCLLIIISLLFESGLLFKSKQIKFGNYEHLVSLKNCICPLKIQDCEISLKINVLYSGQKWISVPKRINSFNTSRDWIDIHLWYEYKELQCKAGSQTVYQQLINSLFFCLREIGLRMLGINRARRCFGCLHTIN